jgi:hypothetical protein
LLAQLAHPEDDESAEKEETLNMIKYMFTKINYAGKISRLEDERKLQAHVEDIFKKRIAYCSDLPPNPNSSHYGFPSIEVKDLNEWVQCLPDVDSFQMFGFNSGVERYIQRTRATETIQGLSGLFKMMKHLSVEQEDNTDIETQTIKISL